MIQFMVTFSEKEGLGCMMETYSPESPHTKSEARMAHAFVNHLRTFQPGGMERTVISEQRADPNKN